MNQLTAGQARLLDFIKANHARGLVPAARTRISHADSRIINNLRALGLVHPTRFIPLAVAAPAMPEAPIALQDAVAVLRGRRGSA